MRHKGLPGLGVPFKNVVRAEIQALKVGATGLRVDRGSPRKRLAEMAQLKHVSNRTFMNM
jgi:hypothetical protein